jgi:mannose-6-phosphate isomerase-like protein (cupin superfamily)
MDRRGQVFENPVTGERVVVLTDPESHPDRVLVAHLIVAPGGRVATEHLHPTLTERFHVIRGRVGFLIGGEKRVLGAGDHATVEPNVPHDWWQMGSEPAEVVVEVAPGDAFVEMVCTLFGLARDGKVNRRGLPGLLQLAVTANTYRDVMVISSPPPWVQRPLFLILASIGHTTGLEAAYPEYLTSDEVVEPAPEAMALLGEDGRLRADG